MAYRRRRLYRWKKKRRFFKRFLKRRYKKRFNIRKWSKNRAQIFKSTVVLDWATDASGTAFAAFNLNGDPTKKTDAGVILVGNPTALNYGLFPNMSLLSGIYDEVRCCGLKVKFMPINPNLNVAGSAIGFLPCWVCYDKDGLSWVPNSTIPTDWKLGEQTFSKVKNMSRPWSMYFRTNKYPLNQKYPSTETTTPTETCSIAGLWHGFLSPIGSLSNVNGCHIYMTPTPDKSSTSYQVGASNWKLPANTLMGCLYITGYFAMKHIS